MGETANDARSRAVSTRSTTRTTTISLGGVSSARLRARTRDVAQFSHDSNSRRASCGRHAQLSVSPTGLRKVENATKNAERRNAALQKMWGPDDGGRQQRPRNLRQLSRGRARPNATTGTQRRVARVAPVISIRCTLCGDVFQRRATLPSHYRTSRSGSTWCVSCRVAVLGPRRRQLVRTE